MYHRLRQRLFAETNTFYTVLKLFKDEPKMHQESFLSLFEFKRVECLYCAIVAFPWTLAPSAGKTTCLLAIMSNRWQDGAKGLESHGDVQQMSSKEEVVEVSKNRHGGVPNEIQERLEEEKVNIFLWGSFWTSHWFYVDLNLHCQSRPRPVSRCGTLYQWSSACWWQSEKRLCLHIYLNSSTKTEFVLGQVMLIEIDNRVGTDL